MIATLESRRRLRAALRGSLRRMRPTQLGSVRDPAELASLPAGVKDKAMDWIHIYAGFIAPSRGALVWDPTAFTLPSYARHPAEQARIFPLSWGFDNEILLSAVYHRQWPPEEQIINGEMKRVIPSGLDLASAPTLTPEAISRISLVATRNQQTYSTAVHPP